ncbi:MAG: kinase-like domain-containing protein [Monoraphidium minutum]|nr:MAG: kinase-like domain-containing protein [Monoraphidium minutum]
MGWRECLAVPRKGHTHSGSGASRKGKKDAVPEIGHQWIVSIVEEDSEDHSGAERKPQWLPAWRRFAKGIVPVIRARPSILIVPLLVTLLLATASALGVVLAARAEERSRRISAQGFALDTATGFEFKLANSLAPVLALSVFVRDNPSVPAISARFDSMAEQLLSLGRVNASASSSGIYLRLAPQALVTLAYPMSGGQNLIGLNLLEDPIRRAATLETIRRREITLQGPILLEQEGFVGLVMRIPIFVANVTDPNETFGATNEAYNCSICYDPATKSRFWGITGSVVDFEQIAGGSGITNARAGDKREPYHGLLGRLEQQGYKYALTVPQPGGTPVVIAKTTSPLDAPLSARVHAPTNETWLLQVEPVGGWVPVWRDALLAMVLAISAATGVLLLCLFVNRQQQIWLLSELKSNNKELTAEKLRTDALLARQYHLINCLMEQGGRLLGGTPRGGGADASGGGAMTVIDCGGVDGPVITTEVVRRGGGIDANMALERIEDMRRAIGTAGGAAAAATGAIQLLDLLGEGGFGKVYRGLWHGTVVAVKTMILPAHMSGALKRERMAIMEAAISSAMTHPNIVQTYTYTIHPMASTHAAVSSDASQPPPDGSGVEGSAAAPPKPSPQKWERGPLATGPSTLNFEVSLVLEYCELGSLRDALDAGAFITADGELNYAAVLDTAADVARAMLHLHGQQVLHSDLKARNVLLKGDSKRGGGAIAKIADFGLALPMRGQDTHVSAYQGTPSHMAPESHIYGRMSKAGDVYAFGILLWELYTGGRPFADTPTALLGHKVSVEGARPHFPGGTPRDYGELAATCWAAAPGDRPGFDRVLEALVAMRGRIRARTPRLTPYHRSAPQTDADEEEGVPESSWGGPGEPALGESGAAGPPEPGGPAGATFGSGGFPQGPGGLR